MPTRHARRSRPASWSPRRCTAPTTTSIAATRRARCRAGIKLWLARTIIGLRFTDGTLQGHEDARIATVVAAVPAAATHDMASLVTPRVPLGLVTASQDRWLLPRFHSERVLKACASCEHIADLPGGGHGACLSPLPPGFDGVLGEMMNDPPGFDRTRELPPVHAKVAAVFVRHLPR